MDEKISKLFLPLLDRLYNTEPAGEPFRKPVDPVKYGCFDYYLYVKHPIDLSTIREKLVGKQYTDAWQFVADIQLMFSNAYLFNKKGTPVYEFTSKLNKIWNSELTPIMQRLNYCCGTSHKFGPQLLFCHGTTPDRYCQIAVGAKYKCYQDSFSFCIPCFNKIDTEVINLQPQTCETSRINLPPKPVKKCDFTDCTNDHWQYENFIQCKECTRRVHQICELYPAEEEEIASCIQHSELEEERKKLCRVPPEFEAFSKPTDETTDDTDAKTNAVTTNDDKTTNNSNGQRTTVCNDVSTTADTGTSSDSIITIISDSESDEKVVSVIDDATKLSIHPSITKQEPVETRDEKAQTPCKQSEPNKTANLNETVLSQALDDELLHLARDVEDSHSIDWAPGSPGNLDSRSRFDGAKELSICTQTNGQRSATTSRSSSIYNTCSSAPSAKNSVDNIAARLSINKMNTEHQNDGVLKLSETVSSKSDKFVCNECYRRKTLGFNLRHRKYSARRLPHTRMSRYIETKVNEYIRENSPTAGEMTVRVLTAYRDKVEVKSEMKEYLKRSRTKEFTQHPHLDEYPDEFEYTNRAIFAWQEIDGVDVCVFGMHVQEYGEDCPEPNRQVVYLSYLDSVHFFRPRQFRTAVYHEILLSYFKYVKKLGFRRVFIWVCPSRKGDDYIFYRHPSEQKMPTLKRLSDWYVHLLDKGVLSGIVERHQNIYDYAITESWTSVLSMPYLSGDYWPGEFERLLNIMIESQKKYEEKLLQKQQLLQMHQSHQVDQDVEEIELNSIDSTRQKDFSELSQSSRSSGSNVISTPNDRSLERYNVLSLSNLYQKSSQPPNPPGKLFNPRNLLIPKTTNCRDIGTHCSPDGDYFSISTPSEESKTFGYSTPSRIEDQPLDLSKSSANTSPESFYDDDLESELSYREPGSYSRKKRRKSASVMGYTKKRGRTAYSQGSRAKQNQSASFEASSKGKASKACRKSSTQANKDALNVENLMDPQQELVKNLERSLKRQKDGFIVVRLSECDCSPHFESQRRREEQFFTCDMMKGREPFLTLARLKNYEFSTLRRAKFSSLAMVKHLGETFNLEPICYECYSFDSSKRHFACPHCKDFYLCTSCHENTHHDHIMSLMAPITLPDIDEFLQPCSPASGANSISSASSTISNKSFNDTTTSLEQSFDSNSKNESSPVSMVPPLHRHLANTVVAPPSLGAPSMPLGCKKQRNRLPTSSAEDEENANFNPFAATDNNKLADLPKQPSPPPSHSSSRDRRVDVEFDQALIESFVRHAQVTYNVDFDEMKSESKKLLAHYWSCPIRDTCSKCKFIVMSCSFMSVLMRSTRMQMVVNCNPSETLTSTNVVPNNGVGTSKSTGSTSGNHLSGINLTTTQRFGYRSKDR